MLSSGWGLVIGLMWGQAVLWEAPVSRNARIELLLDGNLLVLSSTEGIYALSATEGKQLWQCTECKKNSIQSWRAIAPYPIWEAGTLINPPPGIPPDSVERLYPFWRLHPYMVLNTATGKVVFDLDREKKQWDWISGRAIIPELGTLVLFGTGPKDPNKFLTLQTSIMAAYDLKTGSLLWRRPSGDKPGSEQLQSNLASQRDRVYFLTNRALYCIDARSGNTIWRTEIVKGLSLRSITNAYVFIDEERELVIAFGRGRLLAAKQENGEPVWQKPVDIPRNTILHAFSTSQGLLVFTDDVQPGSPQPPSGTSLFYPPYAALLRYEDGTSPWGKRLETPGLLAGYIPLDEKRIFCLFQRERFIQSERPTPENWKVEVDVLDVEKGRFLFRKPISLNGALLHAQSVPGGFLVQTAQRLQYLSEDGQVLWEKPLKRPFSLPFAIREEGGIFEAYAIDGEGQVFRWSGPGNTPTPIGKPLKAFLTDPPQGIIYEEGKLRVWGGSTFYTMTPNGEITCEFQRPPPAQPFGIRLLG
ncbi:MAG: PQQ-binding-like beta-propeller repeat protein, partial [Bacteroidia bacterium]|nr:PQQ-binding-like beta-propeller repeat protein [Bacteroidia bacterium]